MKTKQLLFIAAAVFVTACFSQKTYAKIWRVNNNATGAYGENFGGNINYPVFKQLDNANGSSLVSANNGDTLYVEGSTVTYSGARITKRLTIIGPGYFLNGNPKTSNDVLEAAVDNITFADLPNISTSAGSQLTGIHVLGDNNSISINVSNILIKRCRLDLPISIWYDISDITILQNFFYNANNSAASAITANGNGFPTNFVFNNNICQRTLILKNAATTYSVLECKNNVFDCPAISGGPSILMSVGSSFQNNILKTAAATVVIDDTANLKFSYNISSSSTGQFGTANNNLVVPAINTLFVTSSSPDGAYQIADGSQADNNGSDGTDRGAFGGLAVSDRYTLSGLAAIPVVYLITTAGSTSTDLQVTIQARTIK